MNDKVLSMLGICTKAGKVVSGEFTVEKTVKQNKAYLLIVAEDSSERSKKSYSDMCSFYHTDIFFYGTKETLGRAIGCDYRASIAITDENLANALRTKLMSEDSNGGR